MWVKRIGSRYWRWFITPDWFLRWDPRVKRLRVFYMGEIVGTREEFKRRPGKRQTAELIQWAEVITGEHRAKPYGGLEVVGGIEGLRLLEAMMR